MSERISKIIIPKYCLCEELLSAISHGAGAVFGLVALILCVVKSAMYGDAWNIVSCAIYGSTIIILYTMSTLYHSLKVNTAKRIFRIFDHCSIFLLIAGSYTPFTLITLRGWIGWSLFAVVWGAAIIGIILNAIDIKKYSVISMICYIAMGWVIVLAFKPLLDSLQRGGIILLVIGGLLYTVGAVIYGIGSKVKYMHSIWHFFVLAGSVSHFFTIYIYVI